MALYPKWIRICCTVISTELWNVSIFYLVLNRRTLSILQFLPIFFCLSGIWADNSFVSFTKLIVSMGDLHFSYTLHAFYMFTSPCIIIKFLLYCFFQTGSNFCVARACSNTPACSITLQYVDIWNPYHFTTFHQSI